MDAAGRIVYLGAILWHHGHLASSESLTKSQHARTMQLHAGRTALVTHLGGAVVLIGLGVTSDITSRASGRFPKDLSTPLDTAGQLASVSGTVFLDQNENGVRDGEEPGVVDVVVSDQVDAVASDANGGYRLENSRGYGLVFVTLPNGYVSAGPFWRKVPEGTGERRVDFPLQAAPATDEFTFIHASDTHISEVSLSRTRILRQIVETRRPAFMLVTGDLVRDALRVPEEEARSYYELYVQEMAALPIPVWSVPGNHENFGIERHRSLVSSEHPLYGKGMFHHYLGPNYYSFNYGGVHFVGLDTVDYEDLWYYGHLDDVQLAWLERDLSFLPSNAKVVTFNHIPFYSSAEVMRGFRDTPTSTSLIKIDGTPQYRHTVSNAAEALSRLRRQDHTLALAGHIHLREMLTFEMRGVNTRFHQGGRLRGRTHLPFRVSRSTGCVTGESMTGSSFPSTRWLRAPIDDAAAAGVAAGLTQVGCLNERREAANYRPRLGRWKAAT